DYFRLLKANGSAHLNRITRDTGLDRLAVMSVLTNLEENGVLRSNLKLLDERGCHVGSAGHVSQDAVKRYILEQQGKDVFQFAVYGNPDKQSKIGDFTC
ncbi:MAG: hypothetical protein M0R66_01120, partial [Candidatus Omnitrophica bacterium]|nr:hypothetical protein [Candidatus Omnitrophota bacterium]